VFQTGKIIIDGRQQLTIQDGKNMRPFINFSLLLFHVFGSIDSERVPDLEYVRWNYRLAASDKNICKEMIARLSSETGSYVHLAYLGGFKTIMARHLVKPWEKLNMFTKGKADIENAVKKAGDNAEVRFIRLSVQKNCPWFLGYNKQIEADKRFLLRTDYSTGSQLLKTMISELLKD
jgi:hypothetical protein